MNERADAIMQQLLSLIADGEMKIEDVQEVCKTLYGVPNLSKTAQAGIANSINKHLKIFPSACSNCGPPGWQGMRTPADNE